MTKTLYLECFSGISGDMTVAALLDLGADRECLLNSIKSLGLSGYKIEIKYIEKNGIKACDFNVILDKEYENYDHDMEYLHGNKKIQGRQHPHCHRRLNEIVKIINKSDISLNAKRISLKIFDILAEAEAKAHNIQKNTVFLHEVGAIDSIIDIVSVAVCIDNLGITEVVVPVLYEGKGFVRCQHGVLPVPVPAVLNIASKYDIKLNITECEGEFVTPTGAAIVAAISTSQKLPDSFRILKTGVGAGKRNYERASLLRAMIIEQDDENKIYKIETNIDDCSGEALGYLVQKTLDYGAKDIYFTPIFMKKNRPAYEVNILCEEKDVKAIEDIIFKHTTTIGIRKYRVERTLLNRCIVDVSTKYGVIKVKKCTYDGKAKYYPEYECIAEICDKCSVSYQEVYNYVVGLCDSME